MITDLKYYNNLLVVMYGTLSANIIHVHNTCITTEQLISIYFKIVSIFRRYS